MISRLEAVQGLGFFLYRSAAQPWLDGSDLQDILEAARRRNQALGLTGCLHHEDGLFFQWLEGPAPALVQVGNLILRDGRHQDITFLDQGALDHRRFQDWQMHFSDRKRASLMDWFAGSDNSTVDPGDYSGGVVSFMMSLTT